MSDMTLADELSNAIEPTETPETVPGANGQQSEPPPAEAVGEQVAQDAGRDERGRFTAREHAQAEQETQEQRETVKSAATPPATWSAGAKAVFAQLPDAARREIAKREQDYARGIQQHAEKARLADSMLEEMRPYEAIIRAENGTPQSVIRGLLNTAYRLRTGTPQERGQLIMKLAQEYGADIPHITGQPTQTGQEGQQDLSTVEQMVRQLVAPVFNEIHTLKTERMTAQQAQKQQMERELQGQIDAFRDATNEDGAPKHLYFENVKGLMAAYFANGQANSLDQAYEMACWANPEVRAALQAEQQRTAESQRLAEAKRKAHDAGRAGFNVTGQGGVGIAGATSTSLRDELATQLDAAMGSGRV